VEHSGLAYQYSYGAVAVLLTIGVYFLVKRVTESPYGRSLRAMRDNDIVADSLGKDLRMQRTSVLILGGMIAALSGAILVGFITLWSPGAWGYAETIVLFAAIIIGGAVITRGRSSGPSSSPWASRRLPVTCRPWAIPSWCRHSSGSQLDY